MGTRWAIAKDPKLLERIARQEEAKGRGESVGKLPLLPSEKVVEAKKPPSKAVARATKVATNNQDSRRDSMSFCPQSASLTIVLAGAQLLSHNTSLRMHDAKTSKLKATWFKRIEALMLTNLEIYDRWKTSARFPLIVEEVYATPEANCLDVEAVTAGCKPIIDALVRTRFIPDDSVEFIAQPIVYTFRQRPHGLILRLKPAPKPWGAISDVAMEAAKAIPALP